LRQAHYRKLVNRNEYVQTTLGSHSFKKEWNMPCFHFRADFYLVAIFRGHSFFIKDFGMVF